MAVGASINIDTIKHNLHIVVLPLFMKVIHESNVRIAFPNTADYIKVKLFREGQFVVIHYFDVGLGGWVEWVGVLGTI